jgi:LacI family transcriptional regulator/LacI family repressor for deo operon, udp, cdd, tsx, nupC, and nupG
VTVNNTQGIDDVMEHLKAIGCRCIWHLAGPPEMYDAGERASRFDDYVRRHPELHGSRVLECGINPADGRRTLLEYMDLHRSHPDSVVAFNDATAYGVLDALHERNLPIPEKVAVVGCDDEPATAILGLTSLHMPMRAIGEETAQMLFERLNRSKESSGARHSVLDMSLEVRATTALS